MLHLLYFCLFSEGGYFKAHLIFPKEYPDRPPKLTFVSDIWHPNSKLFRLYEFVISLGITTYSMTIFQRVIIVQCLSVTCSVCVYPIFSYAYQLTAPIHSNMILAVLKVSYRGNPICSFYSR